MGADTTNLYLSSPRTATETPLVLFDEDFCIRTIEDGFPETGGGSARPTTGQLFPRSQ